MRFQVAKRDNNARASADFVLSESLTSPRSIRNLVTLYQHLVILRHEPDRSAGDLRRDTRWSQTSCMLQASADGFLRAQNRREPGTVSTAGALESHMQKEMCQRRAQASRELIAAGLADAYRGSGCTSGRVQMAVSFVHSDFSYNLLLITSHVSSLLHVHYRTVLLLRSRRRGKL
jgi:hypothetical protein